MIGIRVTHQNSWKEADYGSHVDEIDAQTLILMNQHHFLIMKTWDVLSVNANANEMIIEQYTKMSESRISDGATEKNTGVGEASRANGSVFLRHGGTCSTMR